MPVREVAGLSRIDHPGDKAQKTLGPRRAMSLSDKYTRAKGLAQGAGSLPGTLFAILPLMVPPSAVSLSQLPSAFAAAVRSSRSEGELFERCRAVLVERFGSSQIWFALQGTGEAPVRLGPDTGMENAVEVARLSAGATEVVISAESRLAP